MIDATTWLTVQEQRAQVVRQFLNTSRFRSQFLVIMGCWLLALALAIIVRRTLLPRLRQWWGEDSFNFPCWRNRSAVWDRCCWPSSWK